MPSMVQMSPVSGHFEWKVNLLSTQPFWPGWFKGMNFAFLELKLPKMLLVSDLTKLDPEMFKAYTQGKLKLVVVENAGHMIQEDNPRETAKAVHQFFKKFHLPVDMAEKEQKEKNKLDSKIDSKLKKYKMSLS